MSHAFHFSDEEKQNLDKLINIGQVKTPLERLEISNTNHHVTNQVFQPNHSQANVNANSLLSPLSLFQRSELISNSSPFMDATSNPSAKVNSTISTSQWESKPQYSIRENFTKKIKNEEYNSSNSTRVTSNTEDSSESKINDYSAAHQLHLVSIRENLENRVISLQDDPESELHLKSHDALLLNPNVKIQYDLNSSSMKKPEIASTTSLAIKEKNTSLASSFLKKLNHKELTYTQEEILKSIRSKRNPDSSFFSRLKLNLGNDNTVINPNVQTLSSLKNSIQKEHIVKDVHRLKLPNVNHTSIIHFENENQLKVKIITWNLDGSLPQYEDLDNMRELIESDVYHVYAIGSQNCEPSRIPLLFEAKCKWESLLCEFMGSNYIALASSSLMGSHLIVFIRIDLLPWISKLMTSEVATGWFNEIGNRGAVSVSFHIGATSVIFINAHLPDGSDNTTGRNNAFHKIIDTIHYHGKNVHSSIYKDINRIFFFGDLNYRVNGGFGVADSILASGEIHILIQNDQLTLMRAEGFAFEYFDEAPITFRPTYRLARGRNVYEDGGHEKCTPSWTDRILWVPNYDNIQLLSYEGCFYLRSSTHRPVSARFLMTVDVKKSKPLSESHRSIPLVATQSCTIQ